MASLLDIPPEIIDIIIMHLQGPEEPLTAPRYRARTRPRMASGAEQLCPCYDGEDMMKQLLTYSGQNFGKEGRDVVRFGTSHPYITNCIEQSGHCAVVDALVTRFGVVPPITMTIPSAVRYVHVNFLIHILEVADMFDCSRTVNVLFQCLWSDLDSESHQQEGRPLMAHLHRYPQLRKVIISFAADIAAHHVGALTSSAATRLIRKDGHDGISHLDIHPPYQRYLPMEQSTRILSTLVQMLDLPNIRSISVAMPLTDELPISGERDETSWIAVFPSLDSIAAAWPNLKVIRLCTLVMIRYMDQRVMKWDIWVSRCWVHS
jgi:hypothetical protein